MLEYGGPLSNPNDLADLATSTCLINSFYYLNSKIHVLIYPGYFQNLDCYYYANLALCLCALEMDSFKRYLGRCSISLYLSSSCAANSYPLSEKSSLQVSPQATTCTIYSLLFDASYSHALEFSFLMLVELWLISQVAGGFLRL